MKREGYQNRRIIDLFAAKLHNTPIYYIALYRGFNTEKQKGKMKKKLPVVILSVALGMTMIPATCMAAEFNSGDTIKEQTVEDLELSSGENNTKDSQKSEIQWTGI